MRRDENAFRRTPAVPTNTSLGSRDGLPPVTSLRRQGLSVAMETCALRVRARNATMLVPATCRAHQVERATDKRLPIR